MANMKSNDLLFSGASETAVLDAYSRFKELG